MSFTKDIKPYQLRAVYEYLCDQGRIAHVVVNAELPGVMVPQEYVKDGNIVLNITPGAVDSLDINNNDLSFVARFNGTARSIIVPMDAVVAIFDRDTGEGMAFKADIPPPVDDFEGDEINRTATEPKEPELDRKEKKSTKKVTHLRVVK